MYDLTMYNVQFSSVKQWWLKQHASIATSPHLFALSQKKRAKVLLFYHSTKFFCTFLCFFIKFAYIPAKRKHQSVPTFFLSALSSFFSDGGEISVTRIDDGVGRKGKEVLQRRDQLAHVSTG